MTIARWVIAVAALAGTIYLVVLSADQADPLFKADRLVAGLPLILLVVIFIAVTRKPKPNKKKPPGQADADIDNWTGWG